MPPLASPHRPTVASPVTQKGQVTIPVDLRRRLGIKTPDRVEVFLGDDGDIHIRPIDPDDTLRGKYRPVAGRELVGLGRMADDAMQDLADETVREMSEP